MSISVSGTSTAMGSATVTAQGETVPWAVYLAPVSGADTATQTISSGNTATFSPIPGNTYTPYMQSGGVWYKGNSFGVSPITVSLTQFTVPASGSGVHTVANSVTGDVGVVLPVGVALLAIFLGVTVIPKIIYKFF